MFTGSENLNRNRIFVFLHCFNVCFQFVVLCVLFLRFYLFLFVFFCFWNIRVFESFFCHLVIFGLPRRFTDVLRRFSEGYTQKKAKTKDALPTLPFLSPFLLLPPSNTLTLPLSPNKNKKNKQAIKKREKVKQSEKKIQTLPKKTLNKH